MKKRTIFLISSLTAFLSMTCVVAVPNLREPNQTAMREYRLSVLTDENLKSLHAEAVEEVKSSHANWERIVGEAVAMRNANVTECRSQMDDMAYMTRNYPKGCPNYISLDGQTRPRIRGVDEAYEARIMGGCESIQTIWEAKFAGCLP